MFIFICLTFITSLTVLSQESDGDNLPSLGIVRTWAENISQSIIEELDGATAFESLKTAYANSAFEKREINGSELLQSVADRWEEMLQLKMKAVEKIVDVLEESYRNYTYNPAIKLENVSFVNSKNFSKDNITVKYEELFLSEVNLNFSSIQVPTDIYEGDPEILNSILASDPVDEVFRQNAADDEELIWQYFGSAKGFYRSYPAKQWVSSTVFDQYDVRRRGWYIQATSSPKNIMILIDVSGSTFGMTLEVIKVSVSKALDTLGNDDYVMVAKFNKECVNIESCEGFQTFVQANLRNKEHLKEKVQQLEAKGQVDFDEALRFAFDRFKEFEKKELENEAKKNVGANCIRAIMIFTDGGRDMGREILEAENRRNGEPWVRIFVYNVGTDSMVPSDGVKAMACENKGFFSNIRSFGAVRLTTLDYVPVLSRPMVLSNQKNFQWSDIYLDALGLGMMTTLTYPVYNQSKDGTPSEELLGVVGTDITTKNMAETVPQRKPAYNSLFSDHIGPEGYAFGINTNGYILLHPRLKAELGYLSDPPNVDFLEVEFEDENKIKLRKDMINGKTGSETFKTFIMSNDERYVEEVEMTYSYTFINNTTFSVALAQPFFDLVQFAPDFSENIQQQREALTRLAPADNQGQVQVLIAPWDFCESVTSTNKTTEEIYDIIIRLDKETCDTEAIDKLFADAWITSEWVKNIDITAIDEQSLITGVFLATQGGLSRFFPNDILQTEEEKRQKQDPWEQDYYRRPLYKENTYVFSVPYNNGSGSGADKNVTITVSKAIHLNRTNTPAVVGAFLNADVFDFFWKNRTFQANNEFEKEYCHSTSDKPHCYLLDDGGFIIATSLESDGSSYSDVGRFFGEVDGRIMEDLKEREVFKVKESFDYQAACPYIQPKASSGPRMAFVPSVTDMINFNMWLASAAWTFITHTLYDLLVFGVTQPTFIEAQAAPAASNVSCIKLQTQYYFGEKSSDNDEVYCARDSKRECERRWYSARVANTNLLLLLVNAKCGKDVCSEVVVKQVPRDPDPKDIDPCKDAENPRYRKRPPEQCYDFHQNESSICTSGASIVLSGPLVFILFLLLMASHHPRF